MGTWFEVELATGKQKVTGWAPAATVKILGAAVEKSAATQADAPPPQTTPTPTPHHPVPFRLIPHGGYAYGAKGISNQFRAGADLLFGLSGATEYGLTAEAGFKHFFLIAAGPVVLQRLKWPRLGPMRTDLFGGFSAYFTSTSGSKKTYYGPRFGSHFAGTLGRIGSKELEGVLQISADLFLWGGERVLIPVVGSAGLAVHF
jgi:hypothetical protein